jgi:hypothetical protein
MHCVLGKPACGRPVRRPAGWTQPHLPSGGAVRRTFGELNFLFNTLPAEVRSHWHAGIANWYFFGVNPWEMGGRLSCQEMTCFLWNRTVHYRFDKCPPRREAFCDSRNVLRSLPKLEGQPLSQVICDPCRLSACSVCVQAVLLFTTLRIRHAVVTGRGETEFKVFKGVMTSTCMTFLSKSLRRTGCCKWEVTRTHSHRDVEADTDADTHWHLRARTHSPTHSLTRAHASTHTSILV